MTFEILAIHIGAGVTALGGSPADLAVAKNRE